MPPTSSSASAGSRGAPSASSPTSRWCSPACSTSTRRRRRARFVRFCDAFDIPILTFVDVPGFLPGVGQEHNGIIKHGAKLLFAYAEATVPEDHGDHAQGLWRRLRRHGVQASARRLELRLADRRDRGDGRQGRGRDHLPRARRPRRSPSTPREYEERFANPFVAASKGFIDEVIMPHSTRRRVALGLRKLREQAAREPVEEARQYSAVRRDMSTYTATIRWQPHGRRRLRQGPVQPRA